MNARYAVPAILVALTLSACGQTTQERALGGAAVGTAAGLGVAAVTPVDLAAGGLIGAAVGAAAGALTEPETVNLGEPIWQ